MLQKKFEVRTDTTGAERPQEVGIFTPRERSSRLGFAEENQRLNATITCYVGDELLAGAAIVCAGQELELDESGSAVARLMPGELLVEVDWRGEKLQRRLQKHGSAPRFAVDFAAEDDGHPFPDLVGLVGDRFRIEEVVARAATGTVVRAFDRTHNRLVALRAPSDELSAWEEAHQVFVVEARNLIEVEHPNLLHIFDVLTLRGRALLVTEWVVGDTLDLRMREQRIGPQIAWETLLPVASGVAQLHREDIVHRDLHGANIIVRAEGGPKLIDLGLARSLADVYLGAARVRETREHCAPEQFQGLHVTPATDVYQLTLLFYRCWAGRWPFESEDVEWAHVHEEALPLPDAPEVLQRLVARGLSKDPRQRFANAQIWFQEFSSAMESLDLLEEVRTDGARPFPPVVAMAAVGVIAVLLMVGLMSVFGGEDEPQTVELGGPAEVVGDDAPGGKPMQAVVRAPAVVTGEAVDAGQAEDADEESNDSDDSDEPTGGAEAEVADPATNVVLRRQPRKKSTEPKPAESKPTAKKSSQPVEEQAPVQDETAPAPKPKKTEERADDGPALLEIEDRAGDSILLPVD